MSEIADRGTTRAHFVDSGIASLAPAPGLIRDGHVPGQNIRILEESRQTRGSLGAHVLPGRGYVVRGERILDEEAYTPTCDQLSFVPSLDDPGKFLRDEIFEFNAKIKSHSRSRQ